MRLIRKLSFVFILILTFFISNSFACAEQDGYKDDGKIVIDGIEYENIETEFQGLTPEEGVYNYDSDIPYIYYDEDENLVEDLFPNLDGQTIVPTIVCDDPSGTNCYSMGVPGTAIGDLVYGEYFGESDLWQKVDINGQIYYVPVGGGSSGYLDQPTQVVLNSQLNNQYYLNPSLLNTSTKTSTIQYLIDNKPETFTSRAWNAVKSIFTPKRVYGIGQIAFGGLQFFGGALQTELGGTIAVAGVGSGIGAVPGIIIGGGLIVLGGDNMISGGSTIKEGIKNIFTSDATIHENYTQPISSAINFLSTPGSKANTGIHIAHIGLDIGSGSVGLMTKLAKFGNIIGLSDQLYNSIGKTKVIHRMSLGTASQVYNDGVLIGNKAIGKPQWLADFIDTPDPQVWVSKAKEGGSKSSLLSDLSTGRYGKNNEIQVIFDVPNADVSLTKGYKRNFDFTGTNELNLKLSDVSVGGKTVSGYKLPADAEFVHNNAGILDKFGGLFTNPFKAIKGEKLIDNTVEQTAYLRNLQEKTSLSEITAISKEAKLGFESTANKIAAKNGGTLVTSKLKSEISLDRALYKVATDLPNFTDELRLSMVFDKTDDIYSSYVDIEKKYDILRVKNNIKKTKTSGYQDINIIVKNKNGAPGEIQLIQKDIFQAKQIETPINNAFRKFVDENKILDQISMNRPLTPDEIIKYETNNNIIQVGTQASQKIYEPAIKAAKDSESKVTSVLKKVGNLFGNLFK